MVASLQFVEAIKFMTGATNELRSGLTIMDAWAGSVETFEVMPDPECPTCKGQLDFLTPGPDAPRHPSERPYLRLVR